MNLERFEKYVDRLMHEPERDKVSLTMTTEQAYELLLEFKQQLHAARVEGRIHEDTPTATLAGRNAEVNAWIERTQVLARLTTLEQMHEGQPEKTTAWEKKTELYLESLNQRVTRLEANETGKIGAPVVRDLLARGGLPLSAQAHASDSVPGAFRADDS